LLCSGLRLLDGEEVFTGLFALEFIHVPVVSVPTAQVQPGNTRLLNVAPV
jgi:hypothetical protein